TTGPAYVISAIIFTVLGWIYGGSSVEAPDVEQLTGFLSENFHLGLIPMIPPVIVITLLVMRKPPVPSIFIGAITGAAIRFYIKVSEQKRYSISFMMVILIAPALLLLMICCNKAGC